MKNAKPQPISQIVYLDMGEIRDLILNHLEETHHTPFLLDKDRCYLCANSEKNYAYIELVALDVSAKPAQKPAEVVFMEGAKARLAMREGRNNGSL